MRIEIRPEFDEAVMAAEKPVRLAAAQMLILLQSLELSRLWAHRGLHFEKLHGMIEPVNRISPQAKGTDGRRRLT